ncbi:MAG: DUF4199 domain-containing protein [Prevotella sp.]|nr:DUF4199 domain-containing protein [Prevotella sp.]
MTPAEYVQLKAFARIDGLFLALLWLASFACYIVGLSSPLWAMGALLLAFVTPFFVAQRLRLFRDVAREGAISFRRGWGYVVLVFFYAGVLFAMAQYAYFAYMDQGYLLHSLQSMMESPEAREMMTQSGMQDAMKDSLSQLQAMRPIDLALNILTTNIMAGILLGLPIAAVVKQGVKTTNREIQQ